MNRLLFEKTDDAVYLSHLDLMRVFQRAFKRADIMIWHSQGFSPRAYVSIALPLPVGSESVCEILDFEIQDGSVDLAKLPALLNRTMPAGIRVLEAYESAVKIKHLTRLRAQITLEYDRGVPEQAERTIMELFSGGPVLVKKRTKSGGEAELDLTPMIFGLSMRKASAQELELTVLVSAQNPSCNPQLLVSNRMVLLRIRDLDHMLKHKKPSMIHTVDQFVMKGGKMKKLHFGSKNQNAAFNIV